VAGQYSNTGGQISVVASPKPTRKTMSQRDTFKSLFRSAKCMITQLPSHPTRARVSLPEYGPIPWAPGIQNLPTL
jgi:hypothetical protein